MINLCIVIWHLLPTASSVCVCICLSVWNGSLRTSPHMRRCEDAFHHTWRWAALSYEFVWVFMRSQKRVPTALASGWLPSRVHWSMSEPIPGTIFSQLWLLIVEHAFVYKRYVCSTDCARGVMNKRVVVKVFSTHLRQHQVCEKACSLSTEVEPKVYCGIACRILNYFFFLIKEFVTMMYTFLVLSANLLQQQQKMHRVIFIVFLFLFSF